MRALLLILALLSTPARAGWTAGAWPACEHVGGREFSPGVLFKQVWALDLFNAIEERARAVYITGTTNLWADAGLDRPSWWTAHGVTNRVVRYDRGATPPVSIHTQFLPAAKTLAAELATHFLDMTKLDTGDIPGSWHAWQVSGGARTNVALLTQTYTNWVWDCPVTAHSQSFTLYEQSGFADPEFPLHSATGLARSVSLPRDYLTITPFRLLEGFCDPTTAPLGASFVYAGPGQGTSPHAGGEWYWSDFGWDGLRDVLAGMTHIAPQNNTWEPLGDAWYWDAEDGPNVRERTGYAQTSWQRLTPGPDEQLHDDDLADALANAAASEWDSDFPTGGPHWQYRITYEGNARDEVDDLDSYGCEWSVYFTSTVFKPKLVRRATWPPSNVTATVHFLSDVIAGAAPDGNGVWSTEEVDQLVLNTPSSEDVFLAQVGTLTYDGGVLTADPSTQAYLPYEPDQFPDLDANLSDPLAGLRRPNIANAFKRWQTLFTVIEYEWSYP